MAAQKRVGQLVAAEDQRRVVQRPRERRADEQDEPDREPPVGSRSESSRSRLSRES